MSANSAVGSAAYITWNAVVLSGEKRTLTWAGSVNDVDGSSGSDAYVRHLGTQTDLTISLEMTGMSGTAGTAAWTALAENTSGTLAFSPDGTATGMRKSTVVGYIQQRQETSPYNDVQIWSITIMPSAAPAYTFW